MSENNELKDLKNIIDGAVAELVLCRLYHIDRSEFIAQRLLDNHYRKVADDEMVIKKSEYESLTCWNGKFDEVVKQVYQQGIREVLQDLYNHLKCACFPENVSMRWLKETAQKHGIELR